MLHKCWVHKALLLCVLVMYSSLTFLKILSVDRMTVGAVYFACPVDVATFALDYLIGHCINRIDHGTMFFESSV